MCSQYVEFEYVERIVESRLDSKIIYHKPNCIGFGWTESKSSRIRWGVYWLLFTVLNSFSSQMR